jgi:hypothetical protein
MGSENFNSSQEDQSEQQRQRIKRYRIDTIINWIFLVLVSIIGYWIIETDIDTYQSEKLFYRMLNDGVTIEEAGDPYMQRGMTRNLPYKGVSKQAFFLAKWQWRIPVYLGCIFLPLLVGFVRVRSKSRRRWNWPYYALMIASIGYGIYFWGRWTAKW